MFRNLLLGLTVIAFAGAGAGFVGAGAALAQQSGIKRTPLQKVDFPAGYNTVTAIAEVPAGGASGRHSHPGAETGYVLEGELAPAMLGGELQQAYFGPDRADERIAAFIDLARRVLDAIPARGPGAAPLLEALVESATPLLATLNRLTQVYEDLARQQASSARKQLTSVMGDIEQIARHARIVSFNAQVVAARAGHSGREFAVVSGEFTQITGKLDGLVREAVRSAVAG